MFCNSLARVSDCVTVTGMQTGGGRSLKSYASSEECYPCPICHLPPGMKQPKRKTNSQKGKEEGRRALTGVRPTEQGMALLPGLRIKDRGENTPQPWRSIPRHIDHSGSDLGFEPGIFLSPSLATRQWCHTGVSQQKREPPPFLPQHSPLPLGIIGI